MVSINTNLSSIMVQGNLNKATSGMNKAVERLSTGYKINHSSDNAANYSIATNYESKLSSYDMAASNISMGLDLLSVAQDTISTMQNHGARLQALITQARNGTYGTQSLTAMTQEASALISEINRMYTNAEYNNINLFDKIKLPDWVNDVKAAAGIEEGQTVGLTTDLTPTYNGFIANPKTYTDEQVAAMTKVEDVESFTAGQKYSISTKEELQKLATKVNGGTDTTNVEFVLGDDIDLSSIANWTAIGTYSNQFKGTFNGNGHVIENLKINKGSTSYQGLFGITASGSTIKNIGIENCDITGGLCTGGLIGNSNSTVSNSYSTGKVVGKSNCTGGLVGQAAKAITNSYSTASVKGEARYTGGLVGDQRGDSISKSFATGDVRGQQSVGGLVGFTTKSITNSYAIGNVTGNGNDVGGLVGETTSSITRSCATGIVRGNSENTGGLVGSLSNSSGYVNNCYATGNVSGLTPDKGGIGGLIGRLSGSVNNSYATGQVKGQSADGGLVGRASANSKITNCYATGDVDGGVNNGGLVGHCASGTQVTNCYATGNVSSLFESNGYDGSGAGGLIGITKDNTKITNCYATGNAIAKGEAGGLIGGCENTELTNCIAEGNISVSANTVGGLIGYLFNNNQLQNCVSTGKVNGNTYVGGLAGRTISGNIINIENCVTTSEVKGKTAVGNFMGSIYSEDESLAQAPTIVNCKALSQDIDKIDGWHNSEFHNDDIPTSITSGVSLIKLQTQLQVGINGDSSSKITFDTGFEIDLSTILSDIKSDKAYSTITKFMSSLSEKATELGAASNRLESSLESVIVNMENLTSSLSTIKDADVATTSSQYIKMQILQQASATLLATANQSPSIALQLI